MDVTLSEAELLLQLYELKVMQFYFLALIKREEWDS